jgi:hypothetical protein
MGVKDIDAGNSLLVVQQSKSEFQYFDRLVNSYLDRCLDIVISRYFLIMKHISKAQASGYNISKGCYH